MNIQLRYLLLSSIVILLQTRPSYPFASWLVEREASCYVEVRGEKEVVMNEFIKSVNDSSHPDEVQIQVIDSTTGQQVELVRAEDGRYQIPVENHEQNEMIYKYTLKLISPPDLLDLQYIMDALQLPDLWGDELNTIGERMSGRFTGVTSGCENNTRDFGKRNDDGVSFQIIIPPTSKWKNQNEQIVDVVAGWACGHTAVTLTHSIQFITKLGGFSSAAADETKDAAQQQQQNQYAKVVRNEDIDPVQIGALTGAQDDHDLDLSTDVEERKTSKEQGLRGKDVPSSKVKVQRDAPRRNPKYAKQGSVSAIRQFKKKYDADGFGLAKFSTKFYLFGLCAMAFLTYVTLKCLIVMKRHSGKGRRDL